MSKLTIIKLGLMLAIIGWWICIFVILDHIENAGPVITVMLTMSGVMLSVGFVSFCRRERFRWCTGTGMITPESLDRFNEFSLNFGMLQVLTGDRFKPRTNKDGQPIDDAGMVRAFMFDSIVEFSLKAILSATVVVKLVFKIIVEFF